MNFNLYLEDELAAQLEKIAQATGKPRNALIRDAIKALIKEKNQGQWSETILNFEGIQDGITFEDFRDELIASSESEIFS